MPKVLVKTLATFFYLGYFPLIPGTFASIGGLCLYFMVKDNFYLYLGLTLVITLTGFLVTRQAEQIFRQKDSRHIVIDEVSGMLLSLAFLPYDIKVAIGALLSFRILDALKPYPIGRIHNLKGGLGVMGDDILAALYTNIILQLVLRLASFKTS